MHGETRPQIGQRAGGPGQREGQAFVERTAPRVIPQPDRDVGHDHDQRRALGVLLVKTQPQAEQWDGEHPAADSEQSSERAEQEARTEEFAEPQIVHVPRVLRQPERKLRSVA